MKKVEMLLLFFILVGCTAVDDRPDRINIEPISYLPATPISTWVWDSTELESQVIMDKLVTYNIERIFANIGMEPRGKENTWIHMLKEHPEIYEAFIKDAHKADVSVEGLYGETSWTQKENLPGLLTEVQYLLEYNTDYSDAKFDAIHLDIEPHPNDGWNYALQGNDEFLKQFRDNLATVYETVQVHNQSQQDHVKVVLDVSYTTAMNDVEGKPFIHYLADVADELVLMNYVQDQQAFVTLGSDVLAETNLPVTIAIELQTEGQTEEETQAILNDSLGFMTPEELEIYLNQSLPLFEEYEFYNGLAVHQFNSLEAK